MAWLREPNAEPIPGYRLIEPLGSGGFGEVWKCEAPGGMFKAIKFVYGNLQSVDLDGVRAEQEKKALERIREVRHPFVCSLERWEFVEGELVIVMELAERTLHDQFVECQNAGLIGIPRDSLLRYLRDTAEALDFINAKHNLQHLDVKPRNLFLVSDRVKVGDFGLVKNLERQSGSGLLGGVTPLYAPPETYTGKISPHCDQYSLAIVYQELLTGHRPFNGKNVRQLAQQHMQEPPDLRSLPEAERPIVGKALAKNPDERFASCMAFIANIYKARQPVKVEMAGKETALAKGTSRPKTMADTMEDILLDEMALGPAVALAEPPQKKRMSPDPDDPNVEVADMGVTVVQPDTGALRPTIIIGLGSFGRKALLELRCRFLDRFGDLHKLPLLRFLCIDSDPEAANSAMHGAQEVALTRNEFYHLPLQPMSNYRRRNLEVLSEWLPREKLYALPRSLQTQGVRALGRLAFADNHQRLLARLRREIEEATNPDNIYQSVSQTGLALRDNKPRVYIIGAAGGGSSGMVTDLGYAVRRLLDQQRHPDCKVNAFLLCGAPQDPASPKSELANIYATLTEINHFSDPNITFQAQYGVDGQRLVDQGAPYHAVYLLPLAHRAPDAVEQTVSHLGNYLFHELTTPLGLRLEMMRQEDDFSGSGGPPPGLLPGPMRSFGTYSIWFPRGLLLRLAARYACRRLIEGWMATGEDQVAEPVQGEVARFLEKLEADPGLQPEPVAERIASLAQAGSPTDAGTTPGEVLAGILGKLEEQHMQPLAQEDPVNWGKQALNRVRDFVGTGVDDGEVNEWRKTKLTRALSAAALKVAEQWDHKLSQALFALTEHAGARVATAELALEKLLEFFRQTAEAQHHFLEQQAVKTLQSWKYVETALQECATGGGGFRLFGGRSRARLLRGYMDALSHFAHQRLTEEIIAAVRHAYALLAGRLAERGRDLGFCRTRLRHLQENLESGPSDPDEDMASTRAGSDYTLTHSPLPSSSFWEGIRQTATARVVLPDGEVDLERASLRFLQALPPESWVTLDKELYERVLTPRGGLHGACTNSGDMTRQLAEPLLAETSTFLGQHLPIMDVAQILGMEFGYLNADAKMQPSGDQEKLAQQTKDYIDRAVPLIVGKQLSKQASFLLLPASPAGKALGSGLCHVVPDLRLVSVPGQSDLMICREQGWLTSTDLHKLLKPCRAAFETLAPSLTGSPHARFDILDWLPLDP